MGSPNISDPVLRHTVAQNLRAVLNRREWSESELARRTGISQKQINNIVRERYGCSVEAMHTIGRALDIPFWLLTMSGSSESDVLPTRVERLAYAYLSCNERERADLDKTLNAIEKRQRAARHR